MASIETFHPIEAIPLDLLREPLVWFFAEHYRHRDFCGRLSAAAGCVTADMQALAEIHDFLERDLPLHVIDEEDDLFPMLRRRCEPDDRIEKVLGMLSADHAGDMGAASTLKAIVLRALKDRRGLATYAGTSSVIETFCQKQKRHIAMENAVVLPIARRRLSEDDLLGLGRRLAARRGLADPFSGAR